MDMYIRVNWKEGELEKNEKCLILLIELLTWFFAYNSVHLIISVLFQLLIQTYLAMLTSSLKSDKASKSKYFLKTYFACVSYTNKFIKFGIQNQDLYPGNHLLRVFLT